ncbi:MAG: redox-sensing transcriptional repressor Rex [Candidatus Wallbacteria bacterium]|nr:redox-sensing transcriptional repressor Rex [Candidatus Wallbacteria bacterium]
MTGSKQVSLEVIKRLSSYLRDLKTLENNGVTVVSSGSLAELLGISSVQFRKDLSYFGPFGKKGVGYNVCTLTAKLTELLGAGDCMGFALAGAGKLGSAIIQYSSLQRFNIKIMAAFDSDRRKIGKKIDGLVVADAKDMETTVRTMGLKIGVICVPAKAAQQVAERMASAGIIAVLNFAPTEIKILKKVHVSNVDICVEIEALSYFVRQSAT